MDKTGPAPQISVIIPVYNGASHIQESLDHILRSQLQNYEIIIVDDGSSDATPRILSSYLSFIPTLAHPLKNGRSRPLAKRERGNMGSSQREKDRAHFVLSPSAQNLADSSSGGEGRGQPPALRADRPGGGEGFPFQALRLEKNKGVSYARNRGAEIAKGEILLFLDSDVLISPDLLGEIWEFMQAHPEVAACQGRYSSKSYYPDLFSVYKNSVLAFRGFESGDHDINYIHTACAAIRKSIFLQFKFNEKLRRREDIDLGLRLFKAGYAILSLASMEVIHKKKLGFWGFSRYQFLSAREMTLDHLVRGEKSLQEETLSKKQAVYKKLWLLRPVLSFGLVLLLIAGIFSPAAFKIWTSLFLIFLSLSFLLEWRFRFYLFKNAPSIMSLYAFFFYFYDGLLCGAGVISAILKVSLRCSRH